MAQRDRAAPAFIKDLIFRGVDARLKGELDRVRESYEEESGVNVELPMPNFMRTRPTVFPEQAATLVIFTRETAFDAEETQKKHGSDYALAGIGASVYQSTLQVEFLCRGGAGVSGLRDFEVLNIQCQNTIWAAYQAVFSLNQDPSVADGNLILYETAEGMQFDNTRGNEFPLTEYGTFSFHAFVG